MPGPEWTKTGIRFHEPEKLHAYGLQALGGAVKGFQLVLQSFILKHLLFPGKARTNGRQVTPHQVQELIKKYFRRQLSAGQRNKSSKEKPMTV